MRGRWPRHRGRLCIHRARWRSHRLRLLEALPFFGGILTCLGMGPRAERGIRDAAQHAGLAGIDWSDVVRHPENPASSLGASPSSAEDAVQTAIAALRKRPCAWDRTKQPT